MKLIYSTDGLKLQKEILEKKEKEYADIREERKVAHDLSGDGWHDNPHFNRLQQLEANKNIEIKKLREQIEQADIIDYSNYIRPSTEVGIGSYVELKILYTEEKAIQTQYWEIVCFGESDISKSKLAYNTPLAQSILGLYESEGTECELPRGLAQIEVIKISKSLLVQ